MRAAVITAFNQAWQIQDVPEPKPEAGQVVIQIEASGLCGTDLHVHHGHMPFVKLPCIAGHEPVGKIVEVGAGVTDLKVGDRVGVSWVQKGCGRCAACQSHRITACPNSISWASMGGGNAERMLAWASGCTLVPDGVAPEMAAPLFCAGYTVMSGFRSTQPKPGERVAILGLGGLGHLALQIAKAFGHETVALTNSENKRAELKAMGADEVLVIGSHAGEDLMKGGGADIVVSTTNSGAQIAQAVSGLRPGGRLVTLGVPAEPLSLDAMSIMIPQRTVMGGSQGARGDLVDLLALVAAGKVAPKLELYPLDQINAVRDRQAAGKVRYRAVVQP